MNIIKKFNRNRGFTLIELLVVIAIIAMLASVVLASLNTARQKGRDAKRIADMKQVQLALELYFDTNGAYPTGDTSNTRIPTILVTNGHIGAMPLDPVANGVYVYQLCTAPTQYCMNATLEDASNPALDADNDTANVGGCTCVVADPVFNVRP